MGGHAARMEEKRNLYEVLAREPEGKRPLGRPRRSWENNNNMDLRELCWGSMDWIELAQDRNQRGALVNTVMNFRVQYNFGKFLSHLATGKFSRRFRLHGVS
jgi:hypothetical protein